MSQQTAVKNELVNKARAFPHGNFDGKPILSERSVLIALGNVIPEDRKNFFFQELIEGLAKDTMRFKVAHVVPIADFDHYCCRFLGAKSAGYEHSLDNKPQWSTHKPFPVLPGKPHAKALQSFIGRNLTH